MPASSATPPASTSNPTQGSLRLVAQALATTPLQQVAQAINKDDTTACRVRSGDTKLTMDDAVRVLHAAGLKVVLADKVCVDRKRYEAMVEIASAAMADPATARRLTLDE